MKTALITSPNKHKSEVELVIAMFENGLDYLHLKKPKFSKSRLEKYINDIPQRYHHRVILHHHFSLASKYNLGGIHLSRRQKKRKLRLSVEVFFIRLFNRKLKITTSFHSIQSLQDDKRKYHHVMLSPVFDSISKTNYSAAFSERQLKKTLTESHHRVFALGGVDAKTVQLAKETGFSGVVYYGSIWKADGPKLSHFKELQEIVEGEKKYNRPISIKPIRLDIKQP